jgi:hypothetical protein
LADVPPIWGVLRAEMLDGENNLDTLSFPNEQGQALREQIDRDHPWYTQTVVRSLHRFSPGVALDLAAQPLSNGLERLAVGERK